MRGFPFESLLPFTFRGKRKIPELKERLRSGLFFFFFFKFSPEDMFIDFRETRRGREREGEKHRSDAPNPDWRSNPQPFGY